MQKRNAKQGARNLIVLVRGKIIHNGCKINN